MRRNVRALFKKLRRIKRLDDLAASLFVVWYDLPIHPFSYYSPMPDLPATRRNLGRWYREGDFSHAPMDLEGQRAFVAELARYSGECAALPSFAQATADGFGQGYGEVEAQFLHCVLRHAKPRRMIEVGSGVSTYFALHALRMNEASDGVDFSLDCVEPYPMPKLTELAEQNRVTLHVKEVQDVGPELFQALDAGDVLFIDSSHVSKIDSDVNYLYLEILPALRKGVIVHVHDVPFPYLTPPPEHPIFNLSSLWNEAALLKAFLTFNNGFKVLACQSLLHYKSPESLRAVVPGYDPRRHFPDSLWMQKVV
jgi:predicted O-methyltransferase YrrM